MALSVLDEFIVSHFGVPQRTTVGELLGGVVAVSATTLTDYEESALIGTTGADGNITLSGTYTLQGVALAVGNRVLPTAQTNGANNRIWVVAAGAWTIAAGWDTTDTNVSAGKLVPIEAGSNGGKKFQLLTLGTIVLGTTSLSWDTDARSFISNFLGQNKNAPAFDFIVADAKTWNFLARNGAQTGTIRTNSAQPLPVGSEIIVQYDPAGTGVKTITAEGGVTLNGVNGGSLTLVSRTDAYFLKKKSGNEWLAAPMKAPVESFVIACSDESSALTAGTAKVTFRIPYAFTLIAVRASVNTAPTGSTIIIDINEGGTSLLSTKLSIDATEKTSTTAASAAVISDSALADDAEITIDFDQVGSTIAGTGVKVCLIGTRA
jgi:hypothetical protein